MKTNNLVSFFLKIFTPFNRKDAQFFFNARAKRLQTFVMLQNDLKNDNAEINAIIKAKNQEIENIKNLVGSLVKTQDDNERTITQISKFV
jgi:hypothetical protein